MLFRSERVDDGNGCRTGEGLERGGEVPPLVMTGPQQKPRMAIVCMPGKMGLQCGLGLEKMPCRELPHDPVERRGDFCHVSNR